MEDVIVRGKSTLDINRNALEVRPEPTKEMAAVLRNLRRTIWLFTFGTEPAGDYRLTFGRPEGGALPPGTDAALWQEDGLVVVQSHSAIVRRRSRLVEQVAQMLRGAGEPAYQPAADRPR
jgi:hypothetical protein